MPKGIKNTPLGFDLGEIPVQAEQPVTNHDLLGSEK